MNDFFVDVIGNERYHCSNCDPSCNCECDGSYCECDTCDCDTDD